MTEKYYAIRIGDLRRSYPYLMLSENGKTPLFFATRSEADAALRHRSGQHRKVVRVRVEFSPTKL